MSHGSHGRQVGVTIHAVRRYQQRVRPDLEFHEARAELLRLIKDAREVEPPAWAGRPRLCLCIAPGVYVPCEYAKGRRNRYSAATVLTEDLVA